MEKHVMIRLTSVQRDEEGKDEKISLETPAIYREDGNVKSISYEETKLVGMEGTTTKLVIYPDRVELNRTGTFLQQQEYRLGEETRSLYQTPIGRMEVITKTREIGDTIHAGNGRMKLVYDVELKGLFNHLNEIVIDVWEDPEFHGSQGTAEADH